MVATDSISNTIISMNIYKHLDNLIYSYFNQDYDLIGEKIDVIIRDYQSTNSQEVIDELKKDINRFLAEKDIEQTFSDKYGFDVDPKLWGHTASTFLSEIANLL